MNELLQKQPLKRFPGETGRNEHGYPISFRFGHVIQVSERMITVQTETTVNDDRLLSLKGDSYIYFCHRCNSTVSQFQLDQWAPQCAPGIEPCPYCGVHKSLRFLKLGEKVKFHFRFDPAGRWAQWYGELVVE
jgi:hypothetical protein